MAGLTDGPRSLHRRRTLICVNPNQMGEDGHASGGDITLLLRQWSDGQDGAFQQLLPLAYERLRVMAYASMRRERPDHTLQPTALISELYVRLANREAGDWKDRQHFYSFCARAMRWILTDHARARLSERRKLDLQLPLTDDIPWLGGRETDISDLDTALSKLQDVDARKARVLELRIYLGCTAGETAEILSLSKATVDRDLSIARAWLCRELRPEESGVKRRELNDSANSKA
jgi:RNA polymerase sigma factor (TIGR02999 family)